MKCYLPSTICMRIMSITLLVVSGYLNSAKAQVLQKGMDAVVTMYSDTPLTRPVAMVKRVGDPLAGPAPFVVTNNWVPPAISPAITNWNAVNMGQIFGTAIDAPGNVYFAATAMYYSLTSAYPNPQVLANSVVTAATISPSGFRGLPSGGFGLIYKADASNLNTVTCIVTANATNAGAGVGTTKLFNTGYGIGNLAVSTTYNKLYASNLEDGKIYCINPTGVIDYVFDPLVADNGISGIAPVGERIFAVGVNNEFDGTTRLYYSVLVANGASCQSVIRSVQLTTNGNFVTGSDVEEIVLPSSGMLTYVSDIAFSVRGEMLVAEKGDPHNAHVYQYYGRHNSWSIPQDFPISDYSQDHNSAGGVDYGFMKDENGVMVCDSLAWATENAMDGVKWYGIQSIPHNGYVPFSTTPFLQQAYVVDLDGIPGNAPYNQKGRFGDVEFFDSSCTSGPTNICGLVSVSAIKDTGAGCCYNIYASNKYHGEYFTSLNIQTGHLNIDNVTAGSTWGGITYRTGQAVSFGDTSHLWYMPKDSTVGGGFLLARICVSGSGPDVLKVTWIGNAPQFDTVCEKQVPLDGCGIPVDTNCVGIFNQNAICEAGVVKLQFQIRNNSNFTMRSVRIYNLNPDVKPTSSFLPIADLLPGATSPVYTVPLIVKNGAANGCFFFSACDLNVFPGTSGLYPKFCCMDSIQYCVAIPKCDSCDALTITAQKEPGAACCYKLTLNNNLLGTTISCLRFNGIAGTQFALFSGWNIQAPVSSSKITICAPGAGLGNGTYSEFANFCITGTSTPPYKVTVDFLSKTGQLICTKELEFSNCELVKPTCANIVNDSLYCNEDKKTFFSFHIKNNSTFPLYQVDLRLSDTSFTLDKNVIIPDTPIQPGNTGGPYLIQVDSSTAGNKTFCMYLTGHNNIYIPDSLAATQCCTDSLGVICLPYINCDSTCCTTCCEFANLVIPSGVTPNNDAFNESLVIQNSSLCASLKIVVFNRWGNVVYKEENYNNTWKGTNMKGDTLPQGTYFIVVELPNGSKKGSYIDIRY